MSESKNVLMVGSWHLGSVIGACLAEAGNQVSLWDQTLAVAEKWSKGTPPLHEPGLEDLVKKHWGQGLRWTENLESVSSKADWVVLAYDTPINDQDEIMLDVVDEGMKSVLRSGFKNETCFFFTSQLPVGTSRRFRAEILKARPQWKGHVVYQPENLRLGEAIKSFTVPDRMVLGVDDLAKKSEIASAFQILLQNTKTPLNVMGLESAEMVKHALNSFLGTCVVFANEVSEICEKTGADAWDVMASLKQDSRVGPKAFLRPGLGFAGGTLARDVKLLSHKSSKAKNQNLFTQLYEINTERNSWVLQRLTQSLGNLQGKRIVLLGVTYKPFTSTVRRSPAMDIGALLRKQGAECVALDPMADLNELSTAERKLIPFTLEENAEKAFKGADGAVLVTEWPQFLELDWTNLKNQMRTPLIIDTKSHLTKAATAGFNIIVPGKPQEQKL
jgi:UDPglucose 6-dehydrogenase